MDFLIQFLHLLSDDTPTYPVTLKLKAIVPTSPGINYSPGDPVLVNGEPLIIGDILVSPTLGPFGEVIDIPIPDSPIISDDPDDPADVADPGFPDDVVTDPGTTLKMMHYADQKQEVRDTLTLLVV